MGAGPDTSSSGSRRRILSLLVTACRDMPRAVILASVLINLLSLVMPLAVMQVYDRIVPRHAIETLSALMLVIGCVVLVEALLRIARGHVVSWSATQLAWRAYRELLTRLFAAPEAALERESASRTLDRAQALMAYAEWHGSPSRLVLVDVPFVVFFLGLAALIGGWLALVPVALFAVLGVAAIQRGEALRRASAERATEDMKVRDFLIELLTGLTTVKAGAMEAQMLRRFERLQEGLAERSARIVRLGEEAQAFAGLLSNLTQMVTVTLGAVFVIDGHFSVGTLACCVMLAGRAVQPLLRCVAVWNELQTVVVGLEKAEPILALPVAKLAGTTERIQGALSIKLSDITLRHPGGGVVLDRVSLDVPAGSILAIMGRDGAGKSTVVDMLSGRQVADEGRLRVGEKAFVTDSAILKGSIAVVRPGNAAVRGSILDNITMFRRGDEIEFAKEAARLIGLDSDILRLPLGYETPLSEGISAELPGGLVQRIAIARAIARRPGLLILDEANSGLDLRADQMLARGITRLRGHTTIVLITNRPSFAQIADQVYSLDHCKFTRVAMVQAAKGAAA